MIYYSLLFSLLHLRISHAHHTKTTGPTLHSKPGTHPTNFPRSLRVRITTTLTTHPILEGQIFTVDPLTDLLALRASSSPNPAGNYHIIPLSQISAFKILSPPEEGKTEPIAKLDMEALRQREEKAVLEAKKYEATRGKGVSREAQDIFDHVSRT